MTHRSAHGTPQRLKRAFVRTLFLSLIVCPALSVWPQALAQVYYVAKNGSDSNNGSASSPWLTIGHAALEAKAGSTVYVGAGTYNESDAFANSGTAAAPIVFNGQGVAIVDGTGVACCTTPSFVNSNGFLCCNTQGLFNIGASAGVSYLTIEGFTIQNYKTSSKNDVPSGILIAGSGSGINILNNTVKNIQTSAGKNGNAYGIGVFGTSSTPLSVNVSGNTVTGCLTGESETTTYNGNVQNFVVSNNTIYDNDNIGMDAIGFEGVGPTGYDQAKNGDVYGNLIYNNSAFKNPGEGNSYDEDGLYCDGCTNVTFERNTLYGNDLNIEAASETSGEVSSNVIIRNNLVYAANSCGISVGGYAKTGTGGSTDITIVNNSLYDNDTQKTGSGEFQIQYRATGIVFENNVVYTGAEGLFIYGYVSGSGVTSNYNDFYTTSSTTTFELNGKSYSSFATYQSKTGQDANSVFANPDYLTSTTCTSTKESSPPTPITTCSPTPDFDIPTRSPAENTGNATLGSADYGTVDFNGNPRVNSEGQINVGAFEQ
jgi:Right handed beta helix region